MAEYLDTDSHASDPGGMRLSSARLFALAKEFHGPFGRFYRWIEGLGLPHAMLGHSEVARLREHLFYGDSRAACVLSVQPLLVAAYTDELDCVALLKFPDWLAEQYGLKVGSRLLTVNVYEPKNQSRGVLSFFRPQGIADDLSPGPGDMDQYRNFWPVIADFLTDDIDRLEWMKGRVAESEWQHCFTLGKEYLRAGKPFRDGSPLHSLRPARVLQRVTRTVLL